MLNACMAVDVLRDLRPHTAVRTATGDALVLCQFRNLVTVLERGIVRVVERYEVEPVATEGEGEPTQKIKPETLSECAAAWRAELARQGLCNG